MLGLMVLGVALLKRTCDLVFEGGVRLEEDWEEKMMAHAYICADMASE